MSSAPAGSAIIRQGDRDDRWVYLIQSGAVEVIDPRGGSPMPLERIGPLHYFGEWETIFDEPRQREIRAFSDCLLIRFPGETLESFFETEPRFCQAFGAILRTKQRIFEAFDRFEVEVMRGVAQGYVNVPRLLAFYRDLQPALHPFLESPEIDLSALRYAVRRLPENVTRTFVFRLADELSELSELSELGAVGSPGDTGAGTQEAVGLRPVATQARRREVFESMPGQNLVMLRDGSSDLMDLVSLLCLYGTEAAKLRHRVAAGALTDAEKEQLREVWGNQVEARLEEVVNHREQFSVYVQPQRSRYRERRSERWLTQIADATEDALGYSPFRLSPDVEVHIISSNTHSVTNCINPWFTEHLEELTAGRSDAEETGRRNGGYAGLRHYFREHPEAQAAFREAAEAAGILTLADTASTGIQVQLIDSRKVDLSCVDPGISVSGDATHKLLVNIDYAFGEQAEFIMKHLILLFGRNIRSINFFGKAGALQGSRGDLLAPTAFVEQKNDRYLPAYVPEGRIPERIEGHRVHPGPMLTVDGTLLQNRRMIHYYRRIWGCVGIEMEGAHYLRQVIEARELGILPGDVEGRYLYYVSDLPLQHNDSLSRPLSPEEGVPPLYAITRYILSKIL
ncbi:MAG: DUF6909 family protein [Spirochaetaceae bacterium]